MGCGEVVTSGGCFAADFDDRPAAHLACLEPAVQRGHLGERHDLGDRQLPAALPHGGDHLEIGLAAGRHLDLAQRNSTTRRDHDLYAGKLARLKAATTRVN